jgi:integrase
MKKKFTQKFVDEAKPGDKLIDYVAENCAGLHLRITPNGVKSFMFIYRSKITGKPDNVFIGRHPDVELKTATEWVEGARKRNSLSQPVGEFVLAKKGAATVNDLFEDYKKTKLVTLRSGGEIVTALTRLIGDNRWGDLPALSLEKDQIMKALEAIVVERGKKRSASNTQQMFSTMLRWACTVRSYIPFNPIALMPAVGGEPTVRERILNAQELRALWKACHAPEAHGLNPVYADVLLTILTTGCRPGMACGMVESELFGFGGRPTPDYRDKAGPLQDLPKNRMKMGRPFVLPLNRLTLKIIERRLGSTPIFPTPSNNAADRGKLVRVRRLSGVTMELCERLGFKTPFTPHDLRRTASFLLCREFNEHEVGLLLAHEGGRGVMKHYNPQDRWNNLDLKRKMSNRLAEMITEIVSGGAVVALRPVASVA